MLEDYENASRADLLAEVRRGRALREAVEGLAAYYEGSLTATQLRAALAAVDPS